MPSNTIVSAKAVVTFIFVNPFKRTKPHANTANKSKRVCVVKSSAAALSLSKSAPTISISNEVMTFQQCTTTANNPMDSTIIEKKLEENKLKNWSKGFVILLLLLLLLKQTQGDCKNNLFLGNCDCNCNCNIGKNDVEEQQEFWCQQWNNCCRCYSWLWLWTKEGPS